MKQLTPLLLLINSVVFAQSTTQFYNFITKPEIEWASHNYTKVKFGSPSLNNILFTKYANADIKGTMPLWIDLGHPLEINYWTKDSIDNILAYPPEGCPVYDSLGNRVGIPNKPEARIIDSSQLIYTGIADILYIEKGILKSYITWVSPMIPVFTSTGLNLGDGDYFSTCFNFKADYKPKKKNTTIFLSQSRRIIKLDTAQVSTYDLKELYGRNLLQTLWPYIYKMYDHYKIYNAETNSPISREQLTDSLIKKFTISTPDYDSLGNLYHYYRPLSPNDFKTVELLQDWYYDNTKNIVFTRIREMYLYAKKCGSNIIPANEPPILKIVFE